MELYYTEKVSPPIHKLFPANPLKPTPSQTQLRQAVLRNSMNITFEPL